MSKLFAFYLSLLIILVTVQTSGCSLGPTRKRVAEVEAEFNYDQPLPSDVASLRKLLAETQDNEARISIALKHAEESALQTKLWVGVGLAVVAGLVLVVLGIWTTRRFLVELGIGAFALAALGSLLVWVVPYLIWIGAGLAVLVIGIAIFMLVNRERALKQVSDAVDEAKDRIPAFKDGYRDIFRGHIDTAMDRVVNSVRGVK